MANRWAVANGNWSATATWNGGTLPTSADDVFANNFTVTINQNVTALSLRTEAATGINAGGGFTLAASYDVTANLYSGTSTCLTFSANSPSVTNITGNLFGSTTSTNTDIRAFHHTGTGTSNITGNLLGGTGTSGNRRVAARLAGLGTMNINGNITGNTGATNYGLLVDANGTINVTGNLLTNGVVAAVVLTGSLTVTGTLVSGSNFLISSASCNITVNGNQSTSSGSTAGFISHSTSGTVTINGSITHGINLGTATNCVTVGNAANLIVNGNINANATGANHTVLSISGTGTHSITGNITRNSACAGVSISGGTLTITGNLSSTLSLNRANVSVTGTSIVTVNGNITGNPGGTTQSGNLTIGGSGLITVNGNITGSTTAGDCAVVITSTSTSNLVVNGTITAGNFSNAHGVFHNGTGTLTATRVVGNGFGVGAVSIGEAYAIFNSSSTTIFSDIVVEEFEFGSRGAVPIRGNCRISNSSNRLAKFRNLAGTQISLVDPSTLVTPPAASDVRLGVTYNNGNLTGTLAVPPVNRVAAGIAVDNTVGTAVLTQANVWDYALSSASSVAGSVGEKLKKTAIPADIIALG